MKNNISILYVEDENNVREMLSRFLKRFCNNLYVAQNGQEGLELYKKHNPDIIISDIRMPVMNGIEMAKQIKEINPSQLMVIISAHSESDYLFEAIELQLDGYLLKPVDLSVLETKIKKLIHIIENEKASQQLKESEEKFKKIAQASQVGIFIYKEKFIYVNDTFCNITGYTKDEVYQMNSWDLVDEDQKEEVKQVVLQRLEGKEFSKEYSDIKLITKEQKTKVLRVNTQTIQVNGEYAGMGTIVDITDLINTQEQLNIFAQAIEQMDEMVKITNIDGNIIYVNNAVTKHTGYTTIELIGQNNRIFKSGKHQESCYKKLWEMILSGEVYTNTFVNKKKNGEIYYEEQTITPIQDADGNIKYFVSTSQDITQKIHLYKELKTLATKDSLTNIYNRYKLNQIIDEEIVRNKRYNETFALLMFDIDKFKNINDTYGHDAGDDVLVELSKLILDSIRESDKFGRWGGEEFMLLAPKMNRENAIKLANKLRKVVQEHTFPKVGHITVSIGVALFEANLSKESILKTVDEALYLSKKSGRNKVSFIQNEV